MSQDNRNTIIFVVCAAAILIGYQILVLDPAARQRQAEIAQQKAAATQVQQDTATAAASGLQPVGPDGKPRPLSLPRGQAKAASPRIAVETPALSGSVSLRGGRIDDLYLKRYRETVDPASPPVELLRPEGAQNAWFADFGWAGATPAGLPTPTTLWTAQGSRLAPGTPVTLTWNNGAGLVFTRTISVDADFMFTVEDSVANQSGAAVALAPYASIQRQGLPEAEQSSAIVHEGAVGALGDEGDFAKHEGRLIKYEKWKKDGGESYASDGGWIGITDKYWLAALIPASKDRITGQYRVIQAGGVDIYDANFVGGLTTVAPGATLAHTTRFFAGAKSVPVLKKYQADFDIPRFDQAVDWGMFWFFTRPIFSLLDYFYRFMGNFGLAILALTVVVKVVFFPLANKSYESITKMKKAQPQVEELRKKYKDDPPKQQQEIMALYRTERINPLTGCVPMLIQIPVFYALFKVLSVTIEMRHAPFVGWIQDLTARDPTTMWNLFGLIPFNPATVPLLGGLLDSYLHVGLLGIAYGVTMWLTTAMNPPAADPIQQKIFMWMPVLFTFMLAQFAAGLMIYWTWNNVLSIMQQYVIMRRFKVDNPIDDIIARLSGKKKAPG